MRCPLRESMSGEMGYCDARCGWLVEIDDMQLCAVNAMARAKDDLPLESVVTAAEVDANDADALQDVERPSESAETRCKSGADVIDGCAVADGKASS